MGFFKKKQLLKKLAVDETWIKTSSFQWKSPGSTPKELSGIMCSSITNNSAFYCQIQKCLQQCIWWKRLTLWQDKWIMHSTHMAIFVSNQT